MPTFHAQVTSLNKGDKQVNLLAIFLSRKLISRNTTHAQSYNLQATLWVKR